MALVIVCGPDMLLTATATLAQGRLSARATSMRSSGIVPPSSRMEQLARPPHAQAQVMAAIRTATRQTSASAVASTASRCLCLSIAPAAGSSAASPVIMRTLPSSSASRRSAYTPALSSRHFSTSRPIRAPSGKANGAQKACASCNATQPLTSLACPSCGTLQPLPNLEPGAAGAAAAAASALDIYALFDLETAQVPQNGWGVDLRELKGVWRRLMGLTHPDRMGGRSEKEQQVAAQQSAVVNRAYETLVNPLLRAQYLLERNGVPAADEADSLEDAELLMEVMELREQLEEASSEDEAASVRADNQEHLDRTLSALASAFSASPPDFEKARKLTIELRYWLNIDKAAREWAPGKRVELQH